MTGRTVGIFAAAIGAGAAKSKKVWLAALTGLPRRRSLQPMLPAVLAIPLALVPSFGLLFSLGWMARSSLRVP
jgi:hypothetical protein